MATKYAAFTWYNLQDEQGRKKFVRINTTTHPTKPGWQYFEDEQNNGEWLLAVARPGTFHFPTGGQCYKNEAGLLFWTNAVAVTGI